MNCLKEDCRAMWRIICAAGDPLAKNERVAFLLEGDSVMRNLFLEYAYALLKPHYPDGIKGRELTKKETHDIHRIVWALFLTKAGYTNKNYGLEVVVRNILQSKNCFCQGECPL